MTNLRFWVPLLTAVASAALTIGLVRGLFYEDSTASSRKSYEELDDRDKQRVRSHAENLVDRPEELQRLKDIHAVVVEQPELKERLKQIQTYVSELDSEQRNELLPSGEFAEDWLQKIQDGMTAEPKSNRVVEIRLGFGMNLMISEDRISDFVDDFLLDESVEVLARMHSYDNKPAVTFSKLLYLSNDVFRQRSRNRPFDPFEGAKDIYAALERDLFNDDDRATLQKYSDEIKRATSRSPGLARVFFRESPNISITLRFLHYSMEHYAMALKREYARPSEEKRIDAFEGLSRDEQLKLMKEQPSKIRDELYSVALRETCPDEIRQLLDEYDEQRQATRNIIGWQKRGSGQGSSRRSDRRSQGPPGPEERFRENGSRPPRGGERR